MSSLQKQVTSRIQSGILAAVQQMTDELVLATPIDTGVAREGWEIREVPGKKFPVYEVTNNVPYISALNEGHSDQAPAHFIEAIALRYGRAVGQVVTYKDE